MSEHVLEEIDAALRHGLVIIPLLFELTSDGQAPWTKGRWTSTSAELAETTERVKRGIGKLNSEPAPPGTMLEQSELLEKLVGTEWCSYS